MFSSFFIIFTWLVPAFASDGRHVQQLQDGLNAVTQLSRPPISEDTCQRAQSTMLRMDGQERALESLKDQLRLLLQRNCNSVHENEVVTFESDAFIAFSNDDSTWKTQPVCDPSRKTIECRYNHDTGRGIFIFEQPSTYSKPNFLVCAQSTGEWSSLFGSGYAIASKCQASSLYWRGYQSVAADRPMRNDVKGVKAWPLREGQGVPIQFPQPLADICQTVFPDSAYCTPSLLVLRATDKVDVLDACHLKTRRSSTKFLFIRVSSENSKWVCERFDLSRTVEQRRLTSKERQCIPDMWGHVSKSCALPYIPETKEQRVGRGS